VYNQFLTCVIKFCFFFPVARNVCFLIFFYTVTFSLTRVFNQEDIKLNWAKAKYRHTN